MPELEPVDEIVVRLVGLAGGDPGVVERVCRDLYGTLSRRFTQGAIYRGDCQAEWVSEMIAAFCNDLANFAEDNAVVLRANPAGAA